MKQGLDVGDESSCYYKNASDWPGQASPHPGWEANHPSPSSFTDFGKGQNSQKIPGLPNGCFSAFSSILFAFAGASTFPTIQVFVIIDHPHHHPHSKAPMKFLHLLKWDFYIANIDVVVFEQPLTNSIASHQRKLSHFRTIWKTRVSSLRRP